MTDATTPEAELRAVKREARAKAQIVRDAAHARGGDAAARAAAALFEAVGGDAGRLTVSGYLPIRSEIDPRPALALLAAAGAALCMPVVVARGRPLAFRRWSDGAATVEGAFGAHIPADEIEASPTLVIAPLLAFDRQGYRLGYGGGFYDRTLAGLRAAGPVTAVGIAYAAQEIAEVPRDATDARLDMIVTETGVVACG